MRYVVGTLVVATLVLAGVLVLGAAQSTPLFPANPETAERLGRDRASASPEAAVEHGSHSPTRAASESDRSVSVLATEFGTGTPLEGVRVFAHAVGSSQSAEVETDAGGTARLRLWASPDPILIGATHPTHHTLDYPRLLSAEESQARIWLFRTMPLRGVVRAPDGTPVAGAFVAFASVAWAGGTPYLEGVPLCRTDESGFFDVPWAKEISKGSAIVASHRNYPTTWVALSERETEDSYRSLELVFEDGIAFSGVVFSKDGPLSRHAIRVMTDTTALLPGWQPSFVPEPAGGGVGVKTLDLTTDDQGRFRCEGWPRGVAARMMIFNTSTHKVTSVRVFPPHLAVARDTRRNTCVFDIIPGSEVELEVSLERSPIVSMVVDSSLISEERRRMLVMDFDYGEGARRRLRLDWSKGDVIPLRVGITLRDGSACRFEVVARDNVGREQRFGPYVVDSDVSLGTLTLR